MMIDNLLSNAFIAVFLIWLLFVVVMVIRMLNHESISESAPPVTLDPASSRDQAEALCIDEQRRSGRELNGFRWKGE